MGMLSVATSEGVSTAYIACENEVNGISSIGKLSMYTFPEIRQVKDLSPEQGAAQAERGDEQCSGQVLGVCVSPSGRLVAALNDRKVVCVWTATDGAVVGSWQTARKASCLTFTRDELSLLVADKSGDVYSCRLSESGEKPQLVLGHISMVLDMLMTADGRHVISSDRDEKIRVTRYPSTHCIAAYCLGHTEFVACLCLTADGRLVSSGGDMTVRLWEPRCGRQLASAPVEAGESDSSDGSHKVAVTALVAVQTEDTCLLVAQVHSWRRLPVWAVSADHALTPMPPLQLEAAPHALAAAGDRLYVLTPAAAAPLALYAPAGDCRGLQRLPDCPLTETAAAQLGDRLRGSLKTDDVGWLFKQWFDNMSDYLSRKEERLKAEKGHSPDQNSKGANKNEVLADGSAAKRLKPTE